MHQPRSAKGTERFLFQPVGLPEGRKVWRVQRAGLFGLEATRGCA